MFDASFGAGHVMATRDWRVTSSMLVPLEARRVGKRCTLNLSRAQTSYRWSCVVVRRGGPSSGVAAVAEWYRIVACHVTSSSPVPLKTPPCRAAMHVKSVES
ncbi:hypothetical protein TNCV_3629571 [Trichonephila clavipes]|nr:hypothetical protein TNCV_3629571 [Trichonephila clavipes]